MTEKIWVRFVGFFNYMNRSAGFDFVCSFLFFRARCHSCNGFNVNTRKGFNFCSPLFVSDVNGAWEIKNATSPKSPHEQQIIHCDFVVLLTYCRFFFTFRGCHCLALVGHDWPLRHEIHRRVQRRFSNVPWKHWALVFSMKAEFLITCKQRRGVALCKTLNSTS